MKAHAYFARVTQIEYQSDDIALISFQPNVRFRFTAGQFFSLQLEDETSSRLYSIASSPDLGQREPYQFLIRLVPGGLASEAVKKWQPGELIKLKAPYGEFHLPAPHDKNLFFISTGTGLGVMHSILTSQQISQFSGSRFGLFGFRNRTEMVYQECFRKMPELNYRYCLTQEKGALAKDEYSGRVSEFLRAMPEEFPWQETEFYLCGNGEMIETVSSHLTLSRGVPKSSVLGEAFSPQTRRRTPRKSAA